MLNREIKPGQAVLITALIIAAVFGFAQWASRDAAKYEKEESARMWKLAGNGYTVTGFWPNHNEVGNTTGYHVILRRGTEAPLVWDVPIERPWTELRQGCKVGIFPKGNAGEFYYDYARFSVAEEN